LSESFVDYFGAPGGEKTALKNISGLNIAFINYNEFLNSDIKSEQNATVDEIIKIRKKADIVIVFCHWGAEYVGPDEAMKELGHRFIDNGADLVIGGHSHIVGSVEEYKEKRIYYSLGNFIFDQHFNENVRRGLGVEVEINKITRKMSFREHDFYLEASGQTILKQNNAR